MEDIGQAFKKTSSHRSSIDASACSSQLKNSCGIAVVLRSRKHPHADVSCPSDESDDSESRNSPPLFVPDPNYRRSTGLIESSLGFPTGGSRFSGDSLSSLSSGNHKNPPDIVSDHYHYQKGRVNDRPDTSRVLGLQCHQHHNNTPLVSNGNNAHYGLIGRKGHRRPYRQRSAKPTRRTTTAEATSLSSSRPANARALRAHCTGTDTVPVDFHQSDSSLYQSSCIDVHSKSSSSARGGMNAANASSRAVQPKGHGAVHPQRRRPPNTKPAGQPQRTTKKDMLLSRSKDIDECKNCNVTTSLTNTNKSAESKVDPPVHSAIDIPETRHGTRYAAGGSFRTWASQSDVPEIPDFSNPESVTKWTSQILADIDATIFQLPRCLDRSKIASERDAARNVKSSLTDQYLVTQSSRARDPPVVDVGVSKHSFTPIVDLTSDVRNVHPALIKTHSDSVFYKPQDFKSSDLTLDAALSELQSIESILSLESSATAELSALPSVMSNGRTPGTPVFKLTSPDLLRAAEAKSIAGENQHYPLDRFWAVPLSESNSMSNLASPSSGGPLAVAEGTDGSPAIKDAVAFFDNLAVPRSRIASFDDRTNLLRDLGCDWNASPLITTNLLESESAQSWSSVGTLGCSERDTTSTPISGGSTVMISATAKNEFDEEISATAISINATISNVSQNHPASGFEIEDKAFGETSMTKSSGKSMGTSAFKPYVRQLRPTDMGPEFVRVNHGTQVTPQPGDSSAIAKSCSGDVPPPVPLRRSKMGSNCGSGPVDDVIDERRQGLNLSSQDENRLIDMKMSSKKYHHNTANTAAPSSAAPIHSALRSEVTKARNKRRAAYSSQTSGRWDLNHHQCPNTACGVIDSHLVKMQSDASALLNESPAIVPEPTRRARPVLPCSEHQTWLGSQRRSVHGVVASILQQVQSQIPATASPVAPLDAVLRSHKREASGLDGRVLRVEPRFRSGTELGDNGNFERKPKPRSAKSRSVQLSRQDENINEEELADPTRYCRPSSFLSPPADSLDTGTQTSPFSLSPSSSFTWVSESDLLNHFCSGSLAGIYGGSCHCSQPLISCAGDSSKLFETDDFAGPAKSRPRCPHRFSSFSDSEPDLESSNEEDNPAPDFVGSSSRHRGWEHWHNPDKQCSDTKPVEHEWKGCSSAALSEHGIHNETESESMKALSELSGLSDEDESTFLTASFSYDEAISNSVSVSLSPDNPPVKYVSFPKPVDHAECCISPTGLQTNLTVAKAFRHSPCETNNYVRLSKTAKLPTLSSRAAPASPRAAGLGQSESSSGCAREPTQFETTPGQSYQTSLSSTIYSGLTNPKKYKLSSALSNSALKAGFKVHSPTSKTDYSTSDHNKGGHDNSDNSYVATVGPGSRPARCPKASSTSAAPPLLHGSPYPPSATHLPEPGLGTNEPISAMAEDEMGARAAGSIGEVPLSCRPELMVLSSLGSQFQAGVAQAVSDCRPFSNAGSNFTSTNPKEINLRTSEMKVESSGRMKYTRNYSAIPDGDRDAFMAARILGVAINRTNDNNNSENGTFSIANTITSPLITSVGDNPLDGGHAAVTGSDVSGKWTGLTYLPVADGKTGTKNALIPGVDMNINLCRSEKTKVFHISQIRTPKYVNVQDGTEVMDKRNDQYDTELGGFRIGTNCALKPINVNNCYQPGLYFYDPQSSNQTTSSKPSHCLSHSEKSLADLAHNFPNNPRSPLQPFQESTCATAQSDVAPYSKQQPLSRQPHEVIYDNVPGNFGYSELSNANIEVNMGHSNHYDNLRHRQPPVFLSAFRPVSIGVIQRESDFQKPNDRVSAGYVRSRLEHPSNLQMNHHLESSRVPVWPTGGPEEPRIPVIARVVGHPVFPTGSSLASATALFSPESVGSTIRSCDSPITLESSSPLFLQSESSAREHECRSRVSSMPRDYSMNSGGMADSESSPLSPDVRPGFQGSSSSPVSAPMSRTSSEGSFVLCRDQLDLSSAPSLFHDACSTGEQRPFASQKSVLFTPCQSPLSRIPHLGTHGTYRIPLITSSGNSSQQSIGDPVEPGETHQLASSLPMLDKSGAGGGSLNNIMDGVNMRYGQTGSITDVLSENNKNIDAQVTKERAETEAKECCKWLRAVGFPQYAKMYEEHEFPMDLSVVQKDHEFLDTDSLHALYRRLYALNRCARMKLDSFLRKQPEEESEDEDDVALSHQWKFHRRSRTWSRIVDDSGTAGVHGGSSGLSGNNATVTSSADSSAASPLARGLHRCGSGSAACHCRPNFHNQYHHHQHHYENTIPRLDEVPSAPSPERRIYDGLEQHSQDQPDRCASPTSSSGHSPVVVATHEADPADHSLKELSVTGGVDNHRQRQVAQEQSLSSRSRETTIGKLTALGDWPEKGSTGCRRGSNKLQRSSSERIKDKAKALVKRIEVIRGINRGRGSSAKSVKSNPDGEWENRRENMVISNPVLVSHQSASPPSMRMHPFISNPTNAQADVQGSARRRIRAQTTPIFSKSKIYNSARECEHGGYLDANQSPSSSQHSFPSVSNASSDYINQPADSALRHSKNQSDQASYPSVNSPIANHQGGCVGAKAGAGSAEATSMTPPPDPKHPPSAIMSAREDETSRLAICHKEGIVTVGDGLPAPDSKYYSQPVSTVGGLGNSRRSPHALGVSFESDSGNGHRGGHDYGKGMKAGMRKEGGSAPDVPYALDNVSRNSILPTQEYYATCKTDVTKTFDSGLLTEREKSQLPNLRAFPAGANLERHQGSSKPGSQYELQVDVTSGPAMLPDGGWGGCGMGRGLHGGGPESTGVAGHLTQSSLDSSGSDSPKYWERRDSGVGSSLSRSPTAPSRARVRWHSFQKRMSRPPFQQAVPVDSLSLPQLTKLQKYSLLKLTALMEKHSRPSKTGWQWGLHKFWKKMKTPDSKPSSKEVAYPVFGVSLGTMAQHTGQPLPQSVLHAMRFLLSQAPEAVGLFRKSGVRSRILKLKQLCEQSQDLILFEPSQAYDVADLLKQYFRELPEPLLTSKLSETLIAIQICIPPQLRMEAMQKCVILLPDENREVLQTLIYFLHDIAAQAAANQMTAENLAVCFAPSVFQLSPRVVGSSSPYRRHKTISEGLPTERELRENQAAQTALTAMIKHSKLLFTAPEDIMQKCQHMLSEEWEPSTLDDLRRIYDGSVIRYMDICVQAVLKENRDKWKGWMTESSKENVEISWKKASDEHPLKLWRCWADVEAPPTEVLSRVLRERDVWDDDVMKWKLVSKIADTCEVFQYVCNDMPPHPTRDFCVLRYWQWNVPSLRGGCVLVETSISVPGCPVLGGIRANVLASRYMIEPSGSGRSRITHVSRVDIRGRSKAWYNKIYGHICAGQIARIRDSFHQSTDGPETKV